jgi:peptidoglycan biosynthesis protein MviN/MurJ (putative lipid II flippase)
MVKKLFTFLNKEFHGVNEAALLLGSFAFLSQILGLVRDRLLAHSVGAGINLDIYYAAFRIPDFLYVSVASLASITVLMPFIVEKMKGENGKSDAQKFSEYNFLCIYGMYADCKHYCLYFYAVYCKVDCTGILIEFV